MADDYAGNASTTGLIPIGGSVSGSLEANGDSDWFAASLTAGLLYEIDLTTASNFVQRSGVDLSLVNAAGVQVSGLNARDTTLQYIPTVSGTYYATVTSINFNGYGLGNYTLAATPADDYTGDNTTTGRVTIGGSATGTLSPHGDVDWFRVDLTKGFNYRFDVAGAANSTNAATLFMTLLDSNGVAVPNTSFTRSDVFTPAADGTYYLKVYNNSSVGTGDYTITSTPDDYSNNATTSGQLTPGATSAGTLESAGDHDWFAVTLTAGGTYRFNVSAGSSLSPATAVSIVLRNDSGANLFGSGTTTSPLTVKPTATGTYYLDVSAGSTTGSYQVTATTVTLPPTNGGTSTGGSTQSGTSTPGTTTTSTTPVYRFFDTHFGTHFYTSDAGERDTIIATRPDLTSEGVGLSALGPTSDPKVSAVYRFFDTIHGTQFLTSAADERDNIIAARSDLHYEGISFYEYNSAVAGSAPVYRFFDSIYGTHFYTGSEAERATIISSRPDLVPEGVAFYSPNT